MTTFRPAIVLDFDDVCYPPKTGDTKKLFDRAYADAAQYVAHVYCFEQVNPDAGSIYQRYGLITASANRLLFKGEVLRNIPFEEIVQPNRAYRLALERLQNRGHRLAILSNGTRAYVERGLKHLRLTDLFEPELIMGTDSSGGMGKDKAPELFTQIADRLNRPAGALIMVDDKQENLYIPLNLGWQTVWITQDVHRTDHVMAPNLPAWVESLD
jgi:FMN phosphatase YigB (HAD superfamily)